MPRRPHTSSSSGPLGDPPRVDPLDWAASAGVADLVEQEMNACVRSQRRRRLGAVASGLLACVALVWVWQGLPRESAQPVGPGSAIVTAPERERLPDGSTIELKPGARITVAYGEAVRRVVLDQGEAHFQVSKDPSRPFVVVARGVEVRAVGTAFSVGLDASRVEVLVTEGRVAVESASAGQAGTVAPAAPAPALLLDAGNRVSLDTTQGNVAWSAAQPVAMDEINDRLAWRVPWLEMNATPLSEVLPSFNQYSGSRLVLGDPLLGRLTLSGTLRVDNVSVLLQLLETSYGVKAVGNPDGEIVLTATR